MVFVGFEKDHLSVTRGQERLQAFNSSAAMRRYRCSACGAPVYNESLIPDHTFVDVPLGAFERDETGVLKHLELLRPASHLNYEMHVTGIVDAFPQGLTKFSKMPGSPVVE